MSTSQSPHSKCQQETFSSYSHHFTICPFLNRPALFPHSQSFLLGPGHTNNGDSNNINNNDDDDGNDDDECCLQHLWLKWYLLVLQTKITTVLSLLKILLLNLCYLVYLRISTISSTAFCSEIQSSKMLLFLIGQILIFWSLWHPASQSAFLPISTLIFFLLSHFFLILISLWNWTSVFSDRILSSTRFDSSIVKPQY